MSSPAVERRFAATSSGFTGTLAAIGGALILLFTVCAGLYTIAELVGRYLLREAFSRTFVDQLANWLGLGFAGASLLALPAAVMASFVRSGDPPVRSHSALALVPGCLAAFIVALAGVIATMLMMGSVETGLLRFSRGIVSTFGSYESLIFPTVVALAAVVSGARTPEATAAVAAPLVLISFIAVVADISSGQFLVASLVPAVVALVATAALYTLAPARAVTPWILCWPLTFLLELLIITGYITPTEAAGLVGFFAIVIALPLRVFGFGQPIAPILRQAGTEMAAIVCCFAAILGTTFPLAHAGIPKALAEAIGSGLIAVAAAAVAYLVLAYLLTPFFAVAVLLPFAYPLLQQAGFESALVGVILFLLGMAAMTARAARSDPAGYAVSLPPAAAFPLAITYVALAALMAWFPAVVYAPVRALLR